MLPPVIDGIYFTSFGHVCISLERTAYLHLIREKHIGLNTRALKICFRYTTNTTMPRPLIVLSEETFFDPLLLPWKWLLWLMNGICLLAVITIVTLSHCYALCRYGNTCLLCSPLKRHCIVPWNPSEVAYKQMVTSLSLFLTFNKVSPTIDPPLNTLAVTAQVFT